MEPVTWGMLEKSQVDPEKIEEAIARLIDAYDFLPAHKASDIIDHLVQSVVTDKIKDLAVTTGKLNDLAVETGKIKDLAVTTVKINNLAVETGKIKDLAVTTAKINDLAVETGKIKDLAVETGKIKDLAVTNAKINDLTVEKLTGTYLTGKFVRTAASGRRVQMDSVNNWLAFYDAAGNLGGTVLGQSGKIYISGGGFNVECEMWLESALHLDVVDDLIPISNNAYDLGTTSYKWRHLYLAGNIDIGADGYIKRAGIVYVWLTASGFDMYKPIILNTLASDPSGVLGMIFYHTGTKKLRIYGGDPPAWRDIAFA